MQPARSWLPANAVRDARLGAALTAHAQSWAQAWFAGERNVGVRANEIRSRTGLAGDGLSWSDQRGGILLCLAPGAHTPIAMAMLGLETGAHRIGASDHAVLRALAAHAAFDFLARATALFGVEGVHATQAKEAPVGFRFSVGLGSASQVLELFVEEERATAARKSLVAASAPGHAPRPRAEALARQHIRVGAMIGRGQLGLGDLRALSEGDILLLDRGPDDAVDLAVNGAVCARAQALLVKQGDELKMRIDARELQPQ